ncbi:MAG: hypothetical protein Q9186_004355 [Xanthomendoza sp. 1 TL-2023]
MSDHLSATKQVTTSQESLSAANNMAEYLRAQLVETAFDLSNGHTNTTRSEAVLTFDGANDTEGEDGNDEDAAVPAEPKVTAKTSPKKRAVTPVGDEDTSPKKKRTPAKGQAATERNKGTSTANKKGRQASPKPEEGTKSSDSDDYGNEIERPTTPEAQVFKEPKTPKTPKSPTEDHYVQANEKTPRSAKAKTQPKAKPTPKTSPVKGKRAGAEKVAEKVVLPTKWSEATTADKTLVAMKKAGKSWGDIRIEWFKMTGQDTASSTLPNR